MSLRRLLWGWHGRHPLLKSIWRNGPKSTENSQISTALDFWQVLLGSKKNMVVHMFPMLRSFTHSSRNTNTEAPIYIATAKIGNLPTSVRISSTHDVCGGILLFQIASSVCLFYFCYHWPFQITSSVCLLYFCNNWPSNRLYQEAPFVQPNLNSAW